MLIRNGLTGVKYNRATAADQPRVANTLGLEGEAGADLVGGLVELLGIERGANSESNSLTEENVVGNGSDTTVVDLTLKF